MIEDNEGVRRMNDFRKDLSGRMIEICGYEHGYVIQVAKMCEKYPFNKKFDETLELLVKSHEKSPMF